ncbi:MAG: glycosyltransferase family 39 protein [Anaerolineae bacterium]|nr:glycosyltransferase family 39 protein [Anaerolineae bacterium]
MHAKSETVNTNSFKYEYVFLVFVTIIAAGLRFYKLGEWSLWGDEILTMLRARSVFQNILSDPSVVYYVLAEAEITHILTYIPLKLFGMTEWDARLAPALIGIFSIPILYFPIKKIFNPSVGLIAVSLLAVATWHIEWSQNARFYVLLLLFYSLALIAFYKGIEEDNPWYLVLSVFFLYLATRERLFSMFFVPITFGYLFLLMILPVNKPRGLRLRNFLIVFIPAGIIALYFGGFFVVEEGEWEETFVIVTQNSFSELLVLYIEAIGIPLLCMGLLGGIYMLFTERFRIALLLGINAAVPLSAILVLSQIQFVAIRYTFISLITLVIFAGFAVVELISQTPKSAKLLALGCVAILFISPLKENFMYYQYENGARANWKAAFELVEQNQRPDDLILTNTHTLGMYYLKNNQHVIDMMDIDLEFLKKSQHRIWFVHNRRRVNPDIVIWIDQNARLVGVFDVHQDEQNHEMRVYLYDPGEPQKFASPIFSNIP